MTVTRYKRQKPTADAIRDAVMGVMRHTPGVDRRAPVAKAAEPAKPAPSVEGARTVADLTAHHQAVTEPRQAMKIGSGVMARAKRKTRPGSHAESQGGVYSSFDAYKPPPGVLPEGAKPEMALDSAIASWAGESATSAWNFANPIGEAFSEGIGFLGFAYLSQLTQRPEYRRISERIATEMTRKWIRLTIAGEADPKEADESDVDADEDDEGLGADARPDAALEDEEDDDADGAAAGGAVADGQEEDEDEGPTPEEIAQRKRNEKLQLKLKKIEADMKRIDLRGKFKTVAEFDGWMGRSHLYVDTGESDDPDALKTDLGNGSDETSKAQFKKGSLRGIKHVEPIWCYPVNYNAQDPLADDWYNPEIWFAMAKQIHVSRLLTFVGRPLPDILKPSYAFAGLSMSQMAKPYVDNWLRTRQAVTNLIESFSVSGVYTNAQSLLQGGGEEVLDRIELFNVTRTNAGSMVLDKETEEFFNISTPLGTLDHLQAQSQEQMCVQAGTLIRTARGNVPIEEVTLEDQVLTRDGLRSIKWVGVTDNRDTFIEIKVGESVLRVTEEHPVWSVSTNEFVNAANVSPSHSLLVLPSEASMGLPSLGEAAGGGKLNQATIETRKLAAFSTKFFGKLIAAQFLAVRKSITSTRTVQTINSIISKFLPALSTASATLVHSIGPMIISAPNVAILSRLLMGEESSAPARAKREHGRSNLDGCRTQSMISSANPAAMDFSQSRIAQNIALAHACSVQVTTVGRLKLPLQAVYNIEVNGRPEFFANDVLVHNSSVSGIPLIVLLGITPSGLNASSEGELRVFYDLVHAMQENLFRDKLHRILCFIQLNLFGEVDPAIGFEFEPLWSLDEKGEAEVKKIEAETHQIYVDGGSIAPEEVRNIVVADEDSPYNGLDPDETPDPPDTQGLLPGGGGMGGGGAASSSRDNKEVEGAADQAIDPTEVAEDVWAFDDGQFDESKVKRDPDGKFSTTGAGGGAAAGKSSAAKALEEVAASVGGKFKSKKEVIGHLLTKGTTAKEIMETMGWPSVSMPAQAKSLGMKLEKYTENGKLMYKGTPRTDAELKAAKEEATGKKTDATAQQILKNAGIDPSGKPTSKVKSPTALEKIANEVEGDDPALADIIKNAENWGKKKSSQEPVIPQATPEELKKAKKATPLPLSSSDPDAAEAIKAFNTKYAGKEGLSAEQLNQKVQDHKDLMALVKQKESDAAAAAQAKAKEAQEKVAAEKAAKVEKEKKEMEAKFAADPELKTHYEAMEALFGGKDAGQAYLTHAEKKVKSAGLSKVMTPADALPIIAYSGSHYTDVNSELRRGTMTVAQFKFMKSLNAGLEKLPKYEKTTFRKADLTPEQFKAYVPGHIVEERGFTSTSKNQGTWSGDYQFTVHGKSGRDIEKLSSHPGEAEVLFKSGSRFHVKAVKGNHIELEEV